MPTLVGRSARPGPRDLAYASRTRDLQLDRDKLSKPCDVYASDYLGRRVQSEQRAFVTLTNAPKTRSMRANPTPHENPENLAYASRSRANQPNAPTRPRRRA